MSPPATSRRSRASGILRNATFEQLSEAAQTNQAEWIRFEGRLPGVELHHERDVTWICSPVRGRPNSVTMARFTADDADQRIAEIVERYKKMNAPVAWWVGPQSRPLEIGRCLRAAGFHCFKHFPGMAIDLKKINAQPRAPKGLKLQPLKSFDVFDKSEHPFFGPPTTERRRTLIDNECRLCAVRPQRAFAFSASIDSELLGYALLFLGRSVAGIYDVGVVRRARGRGIGTAITTFALKHAWKLKYRYATLQASGDGEEVYRRIGFEEVCRISLWYYSRRHHGGPDS